MKIMSTYGFLTAKDGRKEIERKYEKDDEPVSKKFKYTTPFSNHFDYRHSIDDHNNLRHQVPSIEGTWITQRWVLRVLSFLISISEVNCFLAFRSFVWHGKSKEETLRSFRRRLALSLIYNDDLLEQDSNRKSKRIASYEDTLHLQHSAPPHAREFLNGKWKKGAKFKYQQYTCRGKNCTTKTQNYCQCTPGQWLCRQCHAKHVMALMTEATERD